MADEWQPIKDLPEEWRDGRPVQLYSKGAFHGIPFVGAFRASQFRPDEPWFVFTTNNRLYEHVPTHFKPLDIPK